MKNKILIAEDEKELAKAIKAILQYNNYDVYAVYDGEAAIEATKKMNFDVIIMDIMMPIMDGLEALKTLRKNGINIPIILLTAKSQIEDKVEGLDDGANDYLTKPFNKEELLARIRALVRLSEEHKKKYDIGNIVFDKENSEISNDRASFKLNNKECEIIEYLVKNSERNISQEELLKKVWNAESNMENVVPMYVSYLENKFKALEANVTIDVTNGYKLEKCL